MRNIRHSFEAISEINIKNREEKSAVKYMRELHPHIREVKQRNTICHRKHGSEGMMSLIINHLRKYLRNPLSNMKASEIFFNEIINNVTKLLTEP